MRQKTGSALPGALRRHQGGEEGRRHDRRRGLAAPDPILPRKMVRLFVMSKAWATANGVEKVPDLGAQGTEAHTLRHANGTGPMRLVSQEPGTRRSSAASGILGAFPGNVEEAVYTPIGSAPTRVAALLSKRTRSDHRPADPGPRARQGDAGLQGVAGAAAALHAAGDGRHARSRARHLGQGGPAVEGEPVQGLARPPGFRSCDRREADRGARDARPGVRHRHGVGSGLRRLPEGPGRALADRPEKAKALLAKRVIPEGFTIQLNCPLERYVNTDEICRAVASMLARIGVEVRVKGMVWPEFARMLVNGPSSSFHLIGAAGNSGDTQDTFISVMATRSKEKGRGGTNWAHVDRMRSSTRASTSSCETFDPARAQGALPEGPDDRQGQGPCRLSAPAPDQLGRKMPQCQVTPRADSAVMLKDVTIKSGDSDRHTAGNRAMRFRLAGMTTPAVATPKVFSMFVFLVNRLLHALLVVFVVSISPSCSATSSAIPSPASSGSMPARRTRSRCAAAAPRRPLRAPLPLLCGSIFSRRSRQLLWRAAPGRRPPRRAHPRNGGARRGALSPVALARHTAWSSCRRATGAAHWRDR